MGVFAQITSGPATATGNNPNKQGLIFDKSNNIVESVDDAGLAKALHTALLIFNAQTALTTITTAQNLISQALNAGALNKLKRVLRIKGFVIFTVSAGTPTTTIAIKLGAVTLCTITTAALAASTNGQIQFEFIVSVAATGSSGTLEAHGWISAQLSTSLGTAVASYDDQVTAVSSAVDLTSALTLAATIAASTTMASAQLRLATVEVVN